MTGKKARAADDSDVEGHGIRTRATEEIAPEGVGRKTVKASDEDDVEGHKKVR